MGSQLTKNYDVQSSVSTTGGLAELWHVYSATKKNPQRTPVSIFMFDKRVLDRKRTQAEKDDIVNALKAEVAALTRVRHPGILQIVEPLLEDSKTLAFVTEPISWSLGFLLRNPGLFESAFSDIECRLCLLDLVQALGFLHTEARLVHCAICPDNIYLTPTGFWKLAGLGFAQQILQERLVRVGETLDVLAGTKAMKVAENDIPSKLTPTIYYTAPEIVAMRVCCPASDVFSLGLTIYSLYKVANSQGLTDPYLIQLEEISETGQRDALMVALRQIESKLRPIPAIFHDLLTKMITLDPNSRISLGEFRVAKPFLDQQIKAISFLDHLQEKQEAQTFQFLKGFSALIHKLDSKVLLRRVLPRLLLLLPHENLSAYVLPCILMTLRSCKLPQDLFERDIWPVISKLCGGKEITAQSLYILLSEVDILLDYTNLEVWKQLLFPLIYKGYECAISQIQELILRKTPDIAERITDKSMFKTQLLPRFLQGVVNAKTVAGREAGLQALAALYPYVDRSTLIETILPCVEKVRKLDMTSTIVMNLMNVYEGISKVLGPRDTATSILPAVMPLLVESELTTTEFSSILEKTRNLLEFVAQARLQELRIIADEDREVDDKQVGGYSEQQAEQALSDLLASEQPAEVDLFAEGRSKKAEVRKQRIAVEEDKEDPEEAIQPVQRPEAEPRPSPEQRKSIPALRPSEPSLKPALDLKPPAAELSRPGKKMMQLKPSPSPALDPPLSEPLRLRETPVPAPKDPPPKPVDAPKPDPPRPAKAAGLKDNYKALTNDFFDEFLTGKKK